jgi:hypothetical protein
MKKYEYNHVRMTYSFFIRKKTYNELLTSLLRKMGNEGWDLKGCIQESFTAHTHLIFGREVSQ